MHTGDLLTELLMGYGVEVVFGVPGGQTCALFDGIAKREPKIRHIVCRDERNVAFAADAYARLTHKVGVCDVTVGPGTVKLPSGLMEAYYSSIPILCIISELPLGWQHLYERGAALQAMDQEGLIAQFVKWSTTLTSPEQLPTMLATALRRATTGRPGPVAIVIPHDVFDSEVDAESRITNHESRYGQFPASRTASDPTDVQRAAALLLKAQRPVMVCGGGVHISQAYDEVRELAELLTMPVATTFSGRGSIEDAHPLSLGLLGNMGTSAAKQAVQDADLVFFVGFKSGQNSTFNWTLPRPEQTVIHLDIDPAEIGKVFRTEVGLVGDAKLGLQALITAMSDVRCQMPDSEERATWVRALKEAWQQETIADLTSDAVPIKPQRVMHELNKLTQPDDVVCCDASYVTGWGNIFYEIKKAQRTILAPRGSAGLGFGIPAAMGSAFARPDSRIIALCGDHGVCYSLGELATVAYHKLKVTVLVFNNHGSRWIDHWHRMYFDGSGEPFVWGDTDFATVGRGFGCLGIRVEHPAQLHDALKEALNHDGPAIVDIVVSGEETPIAAYKEALAKKAKVRCHGG